MIKYFCDCCEKQTKQLFEIAYLTHVESTANGYFGGYVDSEGNRISGRTECKNVCITCYNKIMTTAIQKFYELKEQ